MISALRRGWSPERTTTSVDSAIASIAARIAPPVPFASGCVMVFMLAAGSLLVPSVLPSTRSNWFTQTIQVLMLESQDWNAGAAYSFLYILLCTVVVTLVMWLFKVKLSDIAR